MSGGSFNYIYYKEIDELRSSASDREMLDHLVDYVEHLKNTYNTDNWVMLWCYLKHFCLYLDLSIFDYDIAEKYWSKVTTLLKAIEYESSGDAGIDYVNQEFESFIEFINNDSLDIIVYCRDKEVNRPLNIVLDDYNRSAFGITNVESRLNFVTKKYEVKITLFRPGLFIGSSGITFREIQFKLSSRLNHDVTFHIKEENLWNFNKY